MKKKRTFLGDVADYFPNLMYHSLDVTLRKNVALQHFTLHIQYLFKSLCFLKLIFELFSALIS